MKSFFLWVCSIVSVASLYALDVWPQKNFDSTRTGHTLGVGNIVTPEIKWSYFTGGSLSDLTLRFDKNSAQPFVFAMGGHVVRKGINDTVMWDTGTVGIQNVLGLFDVNGDGSHEVFTYGTDTLRILDACLLYTSPSPRDS